MNEWPEVRLGDACRAGSGSVQTGPFGSQLHADDYKVVGIPIITVEHLGDNRITHSNLPLVGNDDYVRLGKYKLCEGDLVFSRVGAIDRCAYVGPEEDGWLFSGRCLRVRPGRNINSKFLSQLLNSHRQRLWILNHSVGSTMACLNTAILSALPLNLPPLPEQRKIASILTTVDRLIEQTEALIEKYRRVKQGMMADLLSRGVDEHGTLRPTQKQAPQLYKQSELGWIPKEWDALRMRDVADVNQGLQIAISRRFKSYKQNRSIYITIQYLNDPTSRINTFYVEELNQGVNCNSDDILFVRTGNTGMVVTNVSGVFHNNFFKILYNRDRVVRDFLMAYLQSELIQRLIMNYAGATTIPDLNHKDFYRLPFSCPTVQEQAQITERLNAINTKLAYQVGYLAKLRTLKTGLMLDLLTGKVRVKVDQDEEATQPTPSSTEGVGV